MTETGELKVDQNSRVPLHVQLQRQLRSLIASGRWERGRRLPSENQLQRNLGISRNTVRQAFNEMQHEGLIERIPGRGTYVAEPAPGGRQKRLIAFIISDFERAEREWELLNGAESAARGNDCDVVFLQHTAQLSGRAARARPAGGAEHQRCAVVVLRAARLRPLMSTRESVCRRW